MPMRRRGQRAAMAGSRRRLTVSAARLIAAFAQLGGMGIARAPRRRPRAGRSPGGVEAGALSRPSSKPSSRTGGIRGTARRRRRRRAPRRPGAATGRGRGRRARRTGRRCSASWLIGPSFASRWTVSEIWVCPAGIARRRQRAVRRRPSPPHPAIDATRRRILAAPREASTTQWFRSAGYRPSPQPCPSLVGGCRAGVGSPAPSRASAPAGAAEGRVRRIRSALRGLLKAPIRGGSRRRRAQGHGVSMPSVEASLAVPWRPCYRRPGGGGAAGAALAQSRMSWQLGLQPPATPVMEQRSTTSTTLLIWIISAITRLRARPAGLCDRAVPRTAATRAVAHHAQHGDRGRSGPWCRC